MTDSLKGMKEGIKKQKKISGELGSLYGHLNKAETGQEKNMLSSQMKSLKNSMKETNQDVLDNLQKTNVARPLNPVPQPQTQTPLKIEEIIQMPEKKNVPSKLSKKGKELPSLERETLKRLKKKEKKEAVKKKIKKPSKYVERANRMFSNYSRGQLNKGKFKKLENNIIRAKLRFIPASYISLIFYTSFLSIFVGIFLFLFFLFFNIGTALPIITFVTENFVIRFLKVFWILFAVPVGTFLFMYFYPALEERASSIKINQELPFATIHMAAISGSMIDPTKIFDIIISTKEYPYLEKEFKRLLNEIDIYGYNLVTALKNVANNSPSKKLSELLTGLATTINSGGSLPVFFEKRAESLLFEYKIEREKESKSAETFMDIYISMVIAAPMILMLLLIIMRISGLGISFSTGMITLMTIMGVFLVNIVFLTLLHLKRTTK